MKTKIFKSVLMAATLAFASVANAGLIERNYDCAYATAQNPSFGCFTANPRTAQEGDNPFQLYGGFNLVTDNLLGLVDPNELEKFKVTMSFELSFQIKGNGLFDKTMSFDPILTRLMQDGSSRDFGGFMRTDTPYPVVTDFVVSGENSETLTFSYTKTFESLDTALLTNFHRKGGRYNGSIDTHAQVAGVGGTLDFTNTSFEFNLKEEFYTKDATSVPEPAAALLMLPALGFMAMRRRKSKK